MTQLKLGCQVKIAGYEWAQFQFQREVPIFNETGQLGRILVFFEWHYHIEGCPLKLMAFLIRNFWRCISGATHRHQVGWMSSSSKLQQCFWSACFSWQVWVMSPKKINNAVPSAIFLGAGYWFNNLHNIICKAHEIFFWIDLPFALLVLFPSSQQNWGLFIARIMVGILCWNSWNLWQQSMAWSSHCRKVIWFGLRGWSGV